MLRVNVKKKKKKKKKGNVILKTRMLNFQILSFVTFSCAVRKSTRWLMTKPSLNFLYVHNIADWDKKTHVNAEKSDG